MAERGAGSAAPQWLHDLLHSVASKVALARLQTIELEERAVDGGDPARPPWFTSERFEDVLDGLRETEAWLNRPDETRPDGDLGSMVRHDLLGPLGVLRTYIDADRKSGRAGLEPIEAALELAVALLRSAQARPVSDRPRATLRTLLSTVTATFSRIVDVELDVSDDPVFDTLSGNRFVSEFLDEAITNAFKHGRPPVRVTARRADTCLEIAVSDSGSWVRGASPGHGMALLRRCAQSLGGELRIDAAASCIALEIPLEEAS